MVISYVFYAGDLGELLGVSSEGFDVYVHEDKSVLGDEHCWN